MNKSQLLAGLIMCFTGISFGAFAQTENPLVGKWKLVKWVNQGKEMDITATYRTDEVYEDLRPENIFISMIGEKINKGTWFYDSETKQLTLEAGVIRMEYKLDFIDSDTRVMTSPQVGRLTYEKIE